MRIPDYRSDSSTNGNAAPGAVLLLAPSWEEAKAESAEKAPDAARHLVLLCGLDQLDQLDRLDHESIRRRMIGAELVMLHDPSDEVDAKYHAYAAQLLAVVKSVLEEKPRGGVLIQLVAASQAEQRLMSGLYAILQTAQWENPRVRGQWIEMEPAVTAEELAVRLADCRSMRAGKIRYEGGRRTVAGWREVAEAFSMSEEASMPMPMPWKDRGIYLITGGMGGIGLIFAREIASRVRQPIVVLTGRSPLSKQKESELDRLRALGAHIVYRQTDVARKDQAEKLIQDIVHQYGSLHGIIHSAGVIRDGFLLRKTEEELQAVLAPKVTGLVNLDRASQSLPLDWFVCFSSAAGSLGNPGQADYAAANAFMDAYASYRNTLALDGRCSGQTLSIGWPLWQEGGMQVDLETEQLMQRSWGMTAMETNAGIRALYQGMASGCDQVLVVSGNAADMREKLVSRAADNPLPRDAANNAQTADPALLRERTVQQLKLLFGEATSMPVSKVDLREPLESYGIDSLMVNELNRRLERIFGELSRTLFYEYQTLGEVLDYLLAELPEKCIAWTGLNGQPEAAAAPGQAASGAHVSGSTADRAPVSDSTADGSPVSEQQTARQEDFPVLVPLKERKRRPGGFIAKQPEQEQKPELEAEQPRSGWEPIAIIGMSGRYPGASNLKQYWDNLQSGKDCIAEIPEERWPVDGFYHPDPQEAAAQGMSYSKWGGFLESFADFDPLFFNLSPREAMAMDPQERLFLQSCWEALEDAGYTRELLAARHRRRVGVFAGITKTGYELYGPQLRERGETGQPYTSFSSVANRVSYFLNLNGPSMPVDTMCSSSLTAVHEACEQLHRGECEVAIAGGVNLYVHPSNYVFLSAQKMLSKDGKCKSFGAGANGFVPGEGVGVVVLKPLARAIADEDPIHAVIRSTTINHGGKTNGYMVPNPAAQGELVRAALNKAGIHARTVTYMEAHGTGTDLGDPIEIAGLTQAFAQDTSDAGFCSIGSAKSNIGHLEAAAGIAGLTKIVLQMKHRKLVPSLHADNPNPNIPFAKTPFAVQQKLEEWQRPRLHINGKSVEYPRIAGVSSFGAGGSNAHVLLEEYAPVEASQPRIAITEQNPALIPLSARSEAQLIKLAEQLLEAIRTEEWPEGSLADIAYTLQVGREAMEERLAFTAGSMHELQAKLERFVTDRDDIDGLYRGQARPDKEAAASWESDMKSAVDRWTALGAYGNILELWAQGLGYDWNRLYKQTKPRRISLPTYPFAKERYFIGWKENKAAALHPERNETARETDRAVIVEGTAAGKGRRPEMKGLALEQCVEWDLKEAVGSLQQIPVDRLNTARNLADFGFDSIGLANLAARLTQHYEIEISPAVFFGHSTIEQVGRYLMSEHRDAVAAFYYEASVQSPVRAASDSRREARGMKTTASSAQPDVREPIAVIGMSGRFPGARNIEEMWAILAEGRSAVNEIPADRFEWRNYYSEKGKTAGATDSKWCGCIPGAAEFDPLFFEISPKEAETMDPRQRLLLQEAWMALEHAGYGAKKLHNRSIGMFVGAEQGDYQLLTKGEGGITSNHNAILAARLSYFLNLKGPVLAVDTACSSGLAAVHQACLSLRSGDCDTAIAAGVNLMLTPEPYIGMSQAGMLSKDGQCFTFDQRANGLVPGEAVAVVVLKPLSSAEADGDPILAVIRGSGINYDGRTNGITAPSGTAQTELLQSVYDQYHIDPGDIDYVVTHGTGTKLGDPVEIHALHDAFKAYTNKLGYCAITSNKTNFGHTFAPSGLVSLINLIQAFRHETIPASLNFEQANEYIHWKDSPFYVNTANRRWPDLPGSSRLGAVSAFGMSGTNVHMVLESYTRAQPEEALADRPPYYLLAISAKTNEALEHKMREMAAMLHNSSDEELLHAGFTLLEGRHHFNHRIAIVAKDRADAAYALNAAASARESLPNLFAGKMPRDFAGQSLLQRYANDLLRQAPSLQGDSNQYRDLLYTAADLYCQGYEIDGNELYGDLTPRIIPLPAYPFATEHYWVSENQASTGGAAPRRAGLRIRNGKLKAKGAAALIDKGERTGHPDEPYELMTFEESWEEQPFEPASAIAGAGKTVVCFLSHADSKLAAMEAARSYSADADVIFISSGASYACSSPHDYCISDSDPDSYEKALRSIKEEFRAVDALLYAWAIENSKYVQDYSAIVRLIKAMAAAGLKPSRMLLAGQFENPLERCYLDSWIGFERSLGLVFPNMRAAAAIVERGDGAPERQRETAVKGTMQKLMAELFLSAGPSVLYRGGKRHVCRVKPAAPVEPDSSMLKQGGTYLITGGCGGLGLLFAEYLAGKYGANLILTGRSEVDEEKQLRIGRLSRLGGRVEYVQADICDAQRMKAGLEAARDRFGPIHGIIHAAGVSGNLTILDKTMDDIQQVLDPKIAGTLALEELTKEDSLDFICYFSSSSAVLGDFGACDYAVGNRFEMAYGSYRNERHSNGRTIVMNWPLWKDGGMGFNDNENLKMYLKSSGQRLLEADEGLAMFERALSSSSGAAQHLVLTGQRSRVHRFLGLADHSSSREAAAPAVANPNPDDSNAAAGKGWRAELKGLNLEQCLEWDLKELVGMMVKIPREKLDIEGNLAEIGFDSIRLGELAALLSGHYGIDITPSLFFGHSTIAKLVRYFADEHKETAQQFYRESAAQEPVAPIVSEPSTHAAAPWRAYRESQSVRKAKQAAGHEPIAIIGMSGRFPDARNIDEMWAIVAEGRSAVRELHKERFHWRRDDWDGIERSGAVSRQWCGIVPGAGEFDPMFFEIPPKEAETMDPRQRLLLQEAWKALEDAGYGADRLQAGAIGMFVGVEEGDYHLLAGDKGGITSNHSAILAARLSYFLNLSGPNMAINTACSSGLVAVHQACMSLRSGESDTAIAAGVNLMLTPDAFAGISRAGILSEDGQCRAFDTRASGTVPGEAVAVVVLKRLSQAEADGDPIYAVIRGSGVNYDGRTNGITAPSGVAQANLYKEVYRQYQINPEHIEYIVTHGTGTKLGDPVEINALNDTFKAATSKESFCALTSSKPNFGHSFAASGLVSLINLVLAMRHEYIPASLNCEQENEYIQWKGSPFYVNKEGKPWIASEGRARTGAVSAFGMSGTNAHLVLESYRREESAAKAERERPPCYLLALSAKTGEALAEKVRDLADMLQRKALREEDLLSVSYTLLQGRHHFGYRCAVVVQDREDAVYALNQMASGEKLPRSFEGKVARDFSGQSAIRQYARELLAKSRAETAVRDQYQDTICALADLYCQGYDLDWNLLFGEARPHKARLPAYPFAREHYWVELDEERYAEQEHLWVEEVERFPAQIVQPIAVMEERSGGFDSKALTDAAAGQLRKLIEEVAGIPGGRLEDDASFEELGLDSFMITALNKKIEQWVGRLDATLFYTYNNVKSLAAYIAETYKDAVPVQTGRTAPQPLAGSMPEAPKPAAVAASGTAGSVRRTANTTASSVRNTLNDTDIAIIGVAGKYPKADDLDQFWRNLLEGRDCIDEIPSNRWPLQGFFEPDRTKAVMQGLSYSKWGGFLDRIEYFDPLFFNISPLEAMYMDPQERLFLETAWSCMEDAGYTRESLRRDGYGNRIGVFAGATFNNYQLHMAEAAVRANKAAYMAPSQTFSIANRVSYMMNFTGPSLTVDTACSSSLYAVHLACDSIRNGQSTMAIAGGVNLSLHPSKYITLAQGQFSASDGRCRAFSEGGTGYVPAEAVGAVLLKPLHEAVKDKDFIYGVIKGTAVSHAGRTNGYTVPSPVSQSLAIETALQQSGIHPRTISCIEAHGTGTALGDPIEIKGLADVYAKYTEETGYCSISSVKSNIGHAEAAAGIAQLTKVLLQLKHQTLVKNVLHGSGLNPNIDFGRTPFVVQDTTEHWKRPEVDGQEVPRRAGISSFGAGGANAHLVIEEYVPTEQRYASLSPIVIGPHMIVLSAKNEDRLREQAARLLSAIRERGLSDAELPKIAYTLQVGREAMDERLAAVVGSIRELEEKLTDFIDGKASNRELFRGGVKRNKDTMALFEADEEMQETVAKWIQRGKQAKLLQLWVKGMQVDWNALYGDGGPGRISLPAYPFAGEPYWVPEIEASVAAGASEPTASASAIHPLLHRNTSDINGVRFSSVFTGREFFLADHVVKGQPVLPGVAYLEMARTAVEQAGAPQNGRTAVRIKNVVWARPIAVSDQPVQVHIDLIPEHSGEIGYQIYTGSPELDAEPVLHSQGSAVLCALEPLPRWDVKGLMAACNQGVISSERIYGAYREIGIDYGPAHQGIEKVYIGSDRVLAKLSVPSSASGTKDRFTLHPSVMDSALQATIAFMLSTGPEQAPVTKAGLPFALEELEVYGSCSSDMWALIRYSEGSKAGSKVQKLDIDLCDDNGTVYVRMKGFSSRIMDGDSGSASKAAEAPGIVMLEPVWKELAAEPAGAIPAYANHLVFLIETDPAVREQLNNRLSEARCVELDSRQEGIAERFIAYSARIFDEIKRVLGDKPKDKVLIQVVLSGNQENRFFAGLAGLLKAASAENAKLVGQLIEVETNAGDIAAMLTECGRYPSNPHIRHRDGKRWTAGWDELIAPQEAALPWKDHGVYLITGGAGGLGLLFAQEMAERVKQPTLILTGRSPLAKDKEAELDKLRAIGAKVAYEQTDVTSRPQVSALLARIREEHGTLDGIIHGAGIIRDNLIVKKTAEELRDVMAAKVAGLANLDEASRTMPLDFVIAFSSVAGATGNPGQADYSAANAFMDAYAAYRNELAARGMRHGRMLSINWPLWKEGGMRVDAEVESIMLRSLGTVPMPTSAGIQALYDGLASRNAQVVVMAGMRSRIKARMVPHAQAIPAQPKAAEAASGAVNEADSETMLEKIQTALMQAVSKLLKVKLADIDVHSELSDYGFDSISLTQFANALNEEYKLELTPTLFFEYTTLNEVAGYLLQEHRASFIAEEEAEAELQSAAPMIAAAAQRHQAYEEAALATEDEPLPFKNRRARLSAEAVPAAPLAQAAPSSQPAQADAAEPIAIVGMSGLFPMASDVNAFWRNIVEGKSCIEEVPKERWDWKESFGGVADEHTKTGVKWGGFIDGVEYFDPLFFGISPREAEMMDPQQRLLLMQVWKAIEDGGIAPKSLAKRPTGVFVAAGPGDYMNVVSQSLGDPQGMTGVVPSLIPNRISYALNLQGPSEYYETACSSTLVALHRAVRSIRDRECEQAVVGAVNLLIAPVGFTGFDAMGYLSPDGKAKSFQAGADGFVRSEGVGAVLLKPLSQAIADRNRIYAVIRGTGVAHGGSGMSLTSPNAGGMKAAMSQAFKSAGIDPRTVSYVEAHGIASPMADGIEVNALKSGYQEIASTFPPELHPDRPLYIGSLKPAIGHGEVASGMSALIKSVLAIRHKLIPGIPGFTAPNEHIQLEGSMLRMTSEHRDWEPLTDAAGKALPRRASINSYGIGGVNAHVVLEEYIPAQEQAPAVPAAEPQLVVLSAKNTDRLAASVRQMLAFVENEPELPLAEFAYTLQAGRELMESRLAFAAGSREELIDGFRQFLSAISEEPDFAEDRGTKRSISIYVGDTRSNEAIRAGDDQGDALVAERRLEELASYWTKGGKISWELLHQGTDVRTLSLPAYPFERRRCWPSPRPAAEADAEPAVRSVQEERVHLAAEEKNVSASASVNSRVTDIVSRILGMAPDEIHPNTPLIEYGLDSILLMQLLQQLQNRIDPNFDLSVLQQCETVRDISERINENPLMQLDEQTGAAAPAGWPQFPELILLHKGVEGTPVFWFHGGLGGVEMYQALAQKSRRPFYGIQARGWLTDRSPLQGVGAMAAYYAHIIQTVQPEGPYDLGGYSLGGVLAYEVIRQLQELGKTVRSVVMLDSPYGSEFQQGAVSRTSAVLQAVNLALASKHFQQPEMFAQTLIHRDEVDLNAGEEQLLRQLIALGGSRGLTKTEEQIAAMIEANVKIQHAYQFDRFSVMPLPDANAVTCYYFRNKRGLIFGELEPYFSTTEDSSALDRARYWEEWERQFPNLHMIDIDVSNHMVLLSEPQSYETIFEFCEKLYAGKGMSSRVLQAFKNKAKKLHGMKEAAMNEVR